MLRSPAGNSWLTGLGVEQEVALRTAVVAVAEQRDSWRTKPHTGAVGFAALCLTDDSARLFTDGMRGSIGTATGAEAIGPGDLLATDLGVVSVDNAEVSVAAGQASVSPTRAPATATWSPSFLMAASRSGCRGRARRRRSRCRGRGHLPRRHGPHGGAEHLTVSAPREPGPTRRLPQPSASGPAGRAW